MSTYKLSTHLKVCTRVGSSIGKVQAHAGILPLDATASRVETLVGVVVETGPSLEPISVPVSTVKNINTSVGSSVLQRLTVKNPRDVVGTVAAFNCKTRSIPVSFGNDTKVGVRSGRDGVRLSGHGHGRRGGDQSRGDREQGEEVRRHVGVCVRFEYQTRVMLKSRKKKLGVGGDNVV